MLAVVYFYPLNPYPGESKFFGALEGIMTSGFVFDFAYSTWTLVTLSVSSNFGYFAFASFGARHASQWCLCRAFLEAKWL